MLSLWFGNWHTYSHGNKTSISELTSENQQHNIETDGNEDEELYLAGTENSREQRTVLIKEREFGLNEREKEDLGESDESGFESEEEPDNKILVAMEDMYGLQALN